MAAMRFQMAVTETGQIAPPILSNAQLVEIGQRMVQGQKDRWRKGINALGEPAAPLRRVTAKAKSTFGKRPIRNMVMTGLVRENFMLRKATMTEIRAENTSREARRHARQAQLFEPMIGLSPEEKQAIFIHAYRAYGLYLARAWRPESG